MGVFPCHLLRRWLLTLDMKDRYNYSLSAVTMENGIVGIWNEDESPATQWIADRGPTSITNSTFIDVDIPVLLCNRSRSSLIIEGNTFSNYNEYGIYLDGYTSDPYYDPIIIKDNVLESSNNVAAITIIGRDPITISNNLILLDNTGGTGIVMSNESYIWGGESQYRNICIPEEHLLEDEYDIYIYDMDDYPYDNLPSTFVDYYKITNNTIVSGHQGIYLDLFTSSTTWAAKIQNNIIVDPVYNSVLDQLSPLEEIYTTGTGILFSRYGLLKPWNESGYNIFNGQYGNRAYYYNTGGGCISAQLFPSLDYYDVDPQLNLDYHLVNGSYNSIDAGNPDLNGDGNDWDTPDIGDQDPDGTRMDLGAFYYQQLSGSQFDDLVIEYEASIGSDWTIESTATVTLMPGAEIFVAPATQIIVDGVLVADAQGEAPITFRSNDPVGPSTPSITKRWDGIKVQNGGTANLNNIVVSNATVGVWLWDGTSTANVSNSLFEDCLYAYYVRYNDNASINNSTINNTKYGIVGYYSDLVISNNTIDGNENGNGYGYRGIYGNYSHSTVLNNVISGHSRYGLWLSRSNPVIEYNEISSSFYGIYMTNYSGPDLSIHLPEEDIQVNNSFSNLNYSFYITSSANPNLGTYSSTYDPGAGYEYSGGFNSIEGSGTWDIYNRTTNGIKAELNWWEESYPMVFNYYGTGSVDHSPTATSILGGLSKSSGILTSGELASMYDRGILLESDSLFTRAVAVFDSIIVGAPTDPNSSNALIAIDRCYSKMDDSADLLVLLELYSSQYEDQFIGFISRYFSAGELARQGHLEAALLRFEECLVIFENIDEATEETAWILFDIAQIYESIEDIEIGLGKNSTSSYLAKVTENYQIVLSEYTYSDAATAVGEILGMDEPLPPADLLPETFALRAAYPNPFNPSTTIQYELPNTTDVTIQIYDLLGRSIWSHGEAFKPAGYYSLVWNGVNQNGKQVASGVYLISFSTPEFRAVQKAVLIR